MKPAVLKTKHRSVGPRKGVGNAFVPDAINPSRKHDGRGRKARWQKSVDYENAPPVTFKLGSAAKVEKP